MFLYRLFVLVMVFTSGVFAQKDAHEVKYLRDIVPDSIITEWLGSVDNAIEISIYDSYKYSERDQHGYVERYPRFKYSFDRPYPESIREIYLDRLELDLDHNSSSYLCMISYDENWSMVMKLYVYNSNWYRVDRCQGGELPFVRSIDYKGSDRPWRILEYKATSDSTYKVLSQVFEGDSTRTNEYDSKGTFEIEKFKRGQ
jgi:hypothetical protein